MSGVAVARRKLPALAVAEDDEAVAPGHGLQAEADRSGTADGRVGWRGLE